jgi:hypothetical protein
MAVFCAPLRMAVLGADVAQSLAEKGVQVVGEYCQGYPDVAKWKTGRP